MNNIESFNINWQLDDPQTSRPERMQYVLFMNLSDGVTINAHYTIYNHTIRFDSRNNWESIHRNEEDEIKTINLFQDFLKQEYMKNRFLMIKYPELHRCFKSNLTEIAKLKRK